MRAILKMKEGSVFGPVEIVLENLTEIHWNYPSEMSKEVIRGFGPMVAFESDIDSTGYTYRVDDIREMEVFNGIYNSGPQTNG